MIPKLKIPKLGKYNNIKLFSSVDTQEVEQFEKFIAEWWNQFGPMKPLHAMNKIRIPFIRDGLVNTGAIRKENINTPKPLSGNNILDVGCGGGILSEPLARLGGTVTGIDANTNLIEKAKYHSKHEGLDITYESTSVEEHACKNSEKYDAVVASEVIEHVTNKDEFLKACVKCLKPSGSIFITTMSKTRLADIVGIQMVENVFKIVPKGTHQYEKFIQPHELQIILKKLNSKTELIHGMVYNVVTNTWHWCSDTSINYALHAIKLSDEIRD